MTNISGDSFTGIGADATVGNVISRPRVQIRNRGLVNGVLYSTQPPELYSGARVTGTVDLNADIETDVTWRYRVARSQPQPGFHLLPGQMPTRVNLSPGSYGNIIIDRGRELAIVAGTYFISSLQMEPGSRLIVNQSGGVVRVFLQTRFIYRGSIQLVQSGQPNPAPRFLIATYDFAPTSVEAPLNAVLVAPNSDVSLISSVDHYGAVFARRIEIHQGARFHHSVGLDVFDSAAAAYSSAVTSFGELLDYEQAESAAWASQRNGQSVVVVTYNDRSTIGDNTIEYPDGPNGEHRIVRPGVSLMGRSVSEDGGRSFSYKGRVSPPAGFAAIWGDPTVVGIGPNDSEVYMVQMSASVDSFRASFGYDAQQDAIVDGTPATDGYCVARSTDHGLTFPAVECLKDAFHDGSTAVVVQGSAGRNLYVAGNRGGAYTVFRASNGSLTLQRLANQPFPNLAMEIHPRLRAYNNRVFIAGVDANGVLWISSLDTATEQWSQATPAGVGIPLSLVQLGDGRNMRQANHFSFDISSDAFGTAEVRTIFENVTSGGKRYIRGSRCSVALGTCTFAGWTTENTPGDQFMPALKVGGRSWGAIWLSRESDPAGSTVEVRGGRLLTLPSGADVLETLQLSPPVVPCMSHHVGSLYYYGDYNEITWLGNPTQLTTPGSPLFYDPRFFAPFTVNSATCAFAGEWTGDMHVGGSVFR